MKFKIKLTNGSSYIVKSEAETIDEYLDRVEEYKFVLVGENRAVAVDKILSIVKLE